MKAKYFYERMIGYKNEASNTGKFYYGYSNGMVDIHHKNNENEYFLIWGSKEVTRYYKEESELSYHREQKMQLDDLKGDDFELFSVVQIIKCGYIVFENAKSENDIKKIISDTHNYIESFEEERLIYGIDDGDDKNDPVPFLVGGSCWNNGMTDEFSFCAKNGVEIQLSTIRKLCDRNMDRKHYGARCIPFIKDKKNTDCIYVKFIKNISGESQSNAIKTANAALNELMEYLPKNINKKYVGCDMKKFIYL